MTTMSNIPEDLVGEILSRVPMTSLGKVRCTCKAWNALSKIQIFGKKAAARKQVLGFMVIGSRVCSFSLDLQGILSERDLVVPSIKKISKFDERKISYVSHIDGLLFCVDNEKLLVWNPYLGKTRWIQRPKIVSDQNDMFAFGYNNNRNHKIFRILHEYNKGDGEDLPDIYELYDFNSNSWRRVPDVKQDFYVVTDRWLVSLKGNTYLVAEDRAVDKYFLLCFDFTMERFGPRLPLPYNSVEYSAAISCVREEQLAILYQDEETMDIWTTTKILPNAVSWIKFFKVEMTTLNGFPDDFGSEIHTESFFIDEEKKVVVAFDKYYEHKRTKIRCYRGAYIIGEDGYFKFMKLGKGRESDLHDPPVFSSYVPSLVQLRFNQRGKRKRNDNSYPKRKKRLISAFCFIHRLSWLFEETTDALVF